MKEKLTALYNTLVTIETKGTNTETMADCLRYLRNLMNEAPDESAKKPPVDGEKPKPKE